MPMVHRNDVLTFDALRKRRRGEKKERICSENVYYILTGKIATG